MIFGNPYYLVMKVSLIFLVWMGEIWYGEADGLQQFVPHSKTWRW
jgi:hypothetical protein